MHAHASCSGNATAAQALERFCLYHALQEHFQRKTRACGAGRCGRSSIAIPPRPQSPSFARANRKRVDFFAWLQWQCELQLKQRRPRAPGISA